MSETHALSVPSVEKVRQEYATRGELDFIIPGGGHGAAAVCRALLDRGYAVAGVANPIDEGGHSARIRWDLYRHLGYWPIIPGDTMNLLGGGFADPAIYAVTNSRLPKDTEGKTADVVFSEAVGGGRQKLSESERLALEAFQRFLMEMGRAIQEELIAPGTTRLPGASLQNLLHVGVMVHVGAYREGIPVLDQDRYLVGSYLLEREMRADRKGLVVPMTFDKVTLVTKHAGGRTVVGGINRVLLAKGAGPNGLEYGDMVPGTMLPEAPADSPEEEASKLAGAKVDDWYPAEVEHGPTSVPFDDAAPGLLLLHPTSAVTAKASPAVTAMSFFMRYLSVVDEMRADAGLEIVTLYCSHMGWSCASVVKVARCRTVCNEDVLCATQGGWERRDDAPCGWGTPAVVRVQLPVDVPPRLRGSRGAAGR